MKGKLFKMVEGYTLSLTGSIDDLYGISNKQLAENHQLHKLSIKNCEAVVNGYDLFELAHEACNITDPLRLDSQKYKQDPYFMIGFNKGFQKALELVEHRLSKEAEFDVEIVTKPYTEVGEEFELELKREPKLDAEGNLILKRIEK